MASAAGVGYGWQKVGRKGAHFTPKHPQEENKGAVETSHGTRPVKVVSNVHKDDIHALLFLRNKQTFVSGSKDGSLKEWDLDLRPVQVIYDPGRVNYKSWITALSRVGKERWVSGTRDGYIHLYDQDGSILREVETAQKGGRGPKCKERNVSRINCLADLTSVDEEEGFVSGRPTQFAFHSERISDFRKGESVQTSENDWVYAVEPLKPRSFLVVTGGKLDLLEKDQEWTICSLMKELLPPDGERQRAFISSITRLESQEHLAGLSIFNGNVLIYDLNAFQVVFHTKEHEKRVWTIENIAPSRFATCADDGLIKLWDPRQDGSVATMKDNADEPARVSVLLKRDEHQLISGSCPDDLNKSKERARFSLWDLRRV